MTVKDLLFRYGSQMRNHSGLFALARFRKQLRSKVVKRDTDLCIEGFQRSGNTYFEMMFTLSNPDANISHHIHGVANVKRAIRLNVPVVVLIREPADAIASLITYDDKLSVEEGIRAYYSYYTKVSSLLEDVLLLNFKDVIDNYNEVLFKVNEKFSRGFKSNSMSSKEIKDVMKERQLKYRNQNATPYPSALKQKKNELHKQFVIQHDSYDKVKSLYRSLLNDIGEKPSI